MLHLKEMRSIAQQRGEKCLSKKYINRKEKLLWKYGKGHVCEAITFSIKVRQS